MSAHRLSFTKVCKTSDVPVGKMKLVQIGDAKILVANVGGVFHAMANPCTHDGGDLSAGKLEGVVVTCPRHGSKFDLRTGKSVSGSRFMGVRSKVVDSKVFEVRVDGDDVMVFQRSIWGM